MKRAILGTALLTCLASTPASAVFHLWQGDMFVTAVNDATICASINMRVGDFVRGVYRGKGLGTNGNFDILGLYFNRAAIQIVPTAPAGGRIHGATAAQERFIYSSAGFLQFTGRTIGSANVTPPAPLTTDPTVTVQLTINDIFSSAVNTFSGCHATYTGTLAKRP